VGLLLVLRRHMCMRARMVLCSVVRGDAVCGMPRIRTRNELNQSIRGYQLTRPGVESDSDPHGPQLRPARMHLHAR
jgi:hypothetical protein